jgi:transcriptional regulator with XRE-family HTH domain
MTNTRMSAWLTRDPGGLSTELAGARGGHSTRDFAKLLGAGWSSSKISKIENGDQLITAADLEAWAEATGVSEETRTQWRDLLEDAARKRAAFRRHRGGSSTAPAVTEGLESAAAYIRVFAPTLIPDLLQTDGYATELARLAGDEVDREALHVRQEVLTTEGRDLRFLIGEAALRTIVGGAAVMSVQLDRLVSAASRHGVKVAVLPLMTTLTALPTLAPVTSYDDETVVDDGVKARHYAGRDAEALTTQLDRLWAASLQGEAARAVILDVIAELPKD